MRPRIRLPRARCALAAAVAVLLLLGRSAVLAHDAPQGWTYPFVCCSGYDCREVPKKEISERPQGYVIERTGEVVSYGDPRIHDSPDGEYHWCSVAGADDTRTICLFVPPRSF